ncbi:phosphatidylserine decarboxylase-domain-containing protein [Polychytrium aggregatum]|uniref:phosphatidylserine decarboxylase-domain-containing protein n=1 Tax=Polychytrium aggregatum TaxID=110093 RepID=UPI0022FDD576|nr:phosphatidylserine decarboxylase-domain-containing protein [Polychytrium aggregatum]KAI9207931.1 phosphatidylserine decarboxylase-domain-containing protein [Polychytrium aggregatum]
MNISNFARPRTPKPASPMSTLRIQIISGRNLMAKDRGGTSDPYAILKLGDQSHKTQVINKTVQPTWNASFDLIVTSVLHFSTIQITVWDKDFIGRDFLGQITIPIVDFQSYFPVLPFDDPKNIPVWHPLLPRDPKEEITGDIQLKVGFVGPIQEDLKKLLSAKPGGGVTRAQLISTDDPIDDFYFNFTLSSNSIDALGDNIKPSDSTDSLDKLGTPTKSSLDHTSLLGLLTIEIDSASNLPATPSRTRGFDCDPFVTVSYNKKTFRTRVVRHNRDPTWGEKVYLHIKHVDLNNNYSVAFGIYDYDTYSGNDHLGSCELFLSDLIKTCGNHPTPVPNIPTVFRVVDLKPKIIINPDLDATQDATLRLRVSFIPYESIRRNFWLTYINTFDSDGNKSINYVELQTLLDNLGSTFSDDTINMMFLENNKTQDEDLSFEDVFKALEARVKPSFGDSKKKRMLHDDEHLIQMKECPVCHNKNIRNRSDFDVISHVALCAHQDMSKVETFLMSGFLTEAYASRKWFTKIFSYVTFGGYAVGKNNANILVQDRTSGQLIEEKMPTYIRLGIRLLYQASASRGAIEARSIKSLLKSLSVKQGKEFDDPNSVKEISRFISFHNLSLEEVELPLSEFKNFNEFFYRTLKPGSRTLASPDSNVAVCAADARTMVFPTIDDATRLWIKGSSFTLSNLLGDARLGEHFADGSAAVFRLAPQDYHRFHSPIDGLQGPTKKIEGTYFTVNPMAVRTSVDVFTENVRTVTVFDSPQFGKVAFVAVGAMLVGSIIHTTKEGQEVSRLDELGYFAFGGSTVIIVFEKGAIQFDSDLVSNSEQKLETLVRVGTSLGVCTAASD